MTRRRGNSGLSSGISLSTLISTQPVSLFVTMYTPFCASCNARCKRRNTHRANCRHAGDPQSPNPPDLPAHSCACVDANNVSSQSIRKPASSCGPAPTPLTPPPPPPVSSEFKPEVGGRGVAAAAPLTGLTAAAGCAAPGLTDGADGAEAGRWVECEGVATAPGRLSTVPAMVPSTGRRRSPADGA